MSEQTPTEPTPEELDVMIAQKLAELYADYHDSVGVDSPLADEWADIEQETEGGFKQDALKHLEEFINKLRKMKEDMGL